jgi:universal stress protein A
MKCQHILVPIDFSPDAERALGHAIELARQFQARLTLLHVIHIPVTTEVNLSSYYVEMETSAQQGMMTYQKRVEDAGLVTDVIVMRGTPFREIVDTASNKRVDLIVMGTHGRTGLQHLLLGSVAERVVRLAPCPVLVTREDKRTVASS